MQNYAIPKSYRVRPKIVTKNIRSGSGIGSQETNEGSVVQTVGAVDSALRHCRQIEVSNNWSFVQTEGDGQVGSHSHHSREHKSG